ncbi:MAG: hypothetical protein AAF353_11860 [Pseudomonadota bacterium]
MRSLGQLSIAGHSLEDCLQAFVVNRVAGFLRKDVAGICQGISLNPVKEGFTRDDLCRVLTRSSRVITLTRRNFLKQYISYLNVQQEINSGHEVPYHLYRPEGCYLDRRFELNSVATVKQVNRLKEIAEKFESVTENLPCPRLKLDYENHLYPDDKTDLFSAVSDFLDIPESGAWTQYRPGTSCDGIYHKLLSNDLAQLISNFDVIQDEPELKPYLNGEVD